MEEWVLYPRPRGAAGDRRTKIHRCSGIVLSDVIRGEAGGLFWIRGLICAGAVSEKQRYSGDSGAGRFAGEP